MDSLTCNMIQTLRLDTKSKISALISKTIPVNIVT